MVECRTAPCWFGDPSTFCTGMGLVSVRKVSLFLCAKRWSIIIPSAPLSSKARALISRPDTCPTSVTLSVIDGERIFRIVSRGTGSESKVSSKWYLFTAT